MKKAFFSCPVDSKNHVSTAFFICFIIEKIAKIKIINILCVTYIVFCTNGRIQSLKKLRFDE